MALPTEPIGSIPRPPALQDAMAAAADGRIGAEALEAARFIDPGHLGTTDDCGF